MCTTLIILTGSTYVRVYIKISNQKKVEYWDYKEVSFSELR